MVNRSFKASNGDRLLKSNRESGMTLIEILVVMIVVGILSAISIPSYLRWIDQTKYAHAKTQMNCTAKDLQVFKLEKGSYPPDVWNNYAPPGINCFYVRSSQQIPFNSQYDYENWPAPNGKCYIQVSFWGKDDFRQSPNYYEPRYATPGFYENITAIGDDLILSLGIQDCD